MEQRCRSVGTEEQTPQAATSKAKVPYCAGSQLSFAASGRARLRVTAWESATGRRCSLAPLDAQARERYLSVACVFGDDSFHANKQPSDAILRCSWDLEDANAWLALDPRRLARAPHRGGGLASPKIAAQ